MATVNVLQTTSKGNADLVTSDGQALPVTAAPVPAGSTSYTPASPANWNPVPAEVAAALDELASVSATRGYAAAPATAARATIDVEASTGTVPSHKVRLFACVTCTLGNVDEVMAVQVSIDGAAYTAPVSAPAAPFVRAPGGHVTPTAYAFVQCDVTMPDAGPRNVGVIASNTNGASTVACALDGITVTVQALQQ